CARGRGYDGFAYW
nr:immunoglobulin heavy chain junction region [Mus musculus]NSM03843.1 immunoglobulin heavy chain junction region [Mus musculus]NSM03860.1 immunoglobulin heavy chain junction region [Mus musculus]NSM04003.1 immunoglobulin heavy chain junction region [Mus musculus]NSM04157.1 immunoglobulin heavy chain junction region [Mus musculus]